MNIGRTLRRVAGAIALAFIGFVILDLAERAWPGLFKTTAWALTYIFLCIIVSAIVWTLAQAIVAIARKAWPWIRIGFFKFLILLGLYPDKYWAFVRKLRSLWSTIRVWFAEIRGFFVGFIDAFVIALLILFSWIKLKKTTLAKKARRRISAFKARRAQRQLAKKDRVD